MVWYVKNNPMTFKNNSKAKFYVITYSTKDQVLSKLLKMFSLCSIPYKPTTSWKDQKIHYRKETYKWIMIVLQQNNLVNDPLNVLFYYQYNQCHQHLILIYPSTNIEPKS